MNNRKLIRKLTGSYLIRCKYWVVCGREHCMHYEPHTPVANHCILMSPVKYCGAVGGFVHDIPLSEIDSNYQCDPNLAFKAKVDADNRRTKKYEQAMNKRRHPAGWDDSDDYF